MKRGGVGEVGEEEKKKKREGKALAFWSLVTDSGLTCVRG